MASRKIKHRQRKATGELTDRQLAFVDAYLADEGFNASNAAREVGYKSPGQAAATLLSNPKVAALIGKRLKERSEACQVKAERVLVELARIAFANPQDMFSKDGVLMDITDMPESIARAIASVRVKQTTNDEGEVVTTSTEVRFWNKNNALELVAKHLGMLDDRLNVEHEVSGNFIEALIKRVEGKEDANVLTIEGHVAK